MSTSDLSNTDIAIQNRKVCIFFSIHFILNILNNMNSNFYSLPKHALKRKDVIV
jgi:hypothetical protein